VVVEFTLPADVPAPGSLYVGVHDGQRSAPTRRREFLRRFMADRWGGLQFMSDRPWSGGRIELAVLPTDTELVAVVEGCAPVYLPLRPGGGAPLSVKLERGFPVRGRVVDRRGQPIPSACVATATFPTDWQIVKTNVAGYFVLEHVPAGPTVLLAHGEGHLTAEATVTVGPDLRDLTLTLDPGTTITGTVHDQTRGSTAPDTRIRSSARTTADGHAGRGSRDRLAGHVLARPVPGGLSRRRGWGPEGGDALGVTARRLRRRSN
jgi:hypothetical protein